MNDDRSNPAVTTAPFASATTQPTITPQAGTWFNYFHSFVHDPTAGLKENFNHLAERRNWGRKLEAKRWVECQVAEFQHAYGTDTTRLEQWQELCRDVYISDPPNSISGCKKVLGSPTIWVNLVNLIDHRNNPEVRVIRFQNYNDFLTYTLAGRVFPKNKAKEHGFIKALLRHL